MKAFKRARRQWRSHPLWSQYISPLGKIYLNVVPWLDILTMLAWGVLFLKYFVIGRLQLLIHPNYFALVLAAGIVLVVIAGVNTWNQVSEKQGKIPPLTAAETQHLTLFPPGVATSLLLIVALSGFIIPPKILASDTALQRGLSETLPYTRTEAQTFYSAIKPEERSLLDWVRTFNAYPEPDAYRGQPANVTGFVVHSPTLSEEYILISRFVITCCAVDAYPVGLPVKLPPGTPRYEQDIWLEIQGEMTTETFGEQRQLVIAAKNTQQIPTPSNPYEF
ncbi:TIGR03943 family putative permease subunit [Spirulina subsalsa]|uniref:TIGR03943 family putative permease subunit n=1 Tax=Spirulina subsalsa TaxID=54311 RepID=UPI0002F603E1|nr:TIGR03943 family protein [Spirulina subsalsa]